MSFHLEVVKRAEMMLMALDEGDEAGTIRAAKLGCLAMRYLLEASPFRDAPSRLEESMAADSRIWIKHHFCDDNFIDDFLRIERRVLKSGGLDPILADAVIENCSSAIKDMRKSLRKEPEEWLCKLRRLHDAFEPVKHRACHVAEDLKIKDRYQGFYPRQTIHGSLDDDWARVRIRLRGVFKALVGGSTYVLNTSADVALLLPIFTHASQLVGGWLFGIGADQLMRGSG